MTIFTNGKASWDDRPVERFTQIVYRLKPKTATAVEREIGNELMDRADSAGIHSHMWMMFDPEPSGTPCLLTVEPDTSTEWLKSTVAWLQNQPSIVSAKFILPGDHPNAAT